MKEMRNFSNSVYNNNNNNNQEMFNSGAFLTMNKRGTMRNGLNTIDTPATMVKEKKQPYNYSIANKVSRFLCSILGVFLV